MQRTRNRTVGQAIAAAGAFVRDDFVHVVDVLHFRMDGALGADFTAEAARDAETFDDFHFMQEIIRHRDTKDTNSLNPFRSQKRHRVPPKARLGSGAHGRNRKSKTSSIGF